MPHIQILLAPGSIPEVACVPFTSCECWAHMARVARVSQGWLWMTFILLGAHERSDFAQKLLKQTAYARCHTPKCRLRLDPYQEWPALLSPRASVGHTWPEGHVCRRVGWITLLCLCAHERSEFAQKLLKEQLAHGATHPNIHCAWIYTRSGLRSSHLPRVLGTHGQRGTCVAGLAVDDLNLIRCARAERVRTKAVETNSLRTVPHTQMSTALALEPHTPDMIHKDQERKAHSDTLKTKSTRIHIPLKLNATFVSIQPIYIMSTFVKLNTEVNKNPDRAHTDTNFCFVFADNVKP